MIKPKKSLGQNFLTDQNILKKMIEHVGQYLVMQQLL